MGEVKVGDIAIFLGKDRDYFCLEEGPILPLRKNWSAGGELIVPISQWKQIQHSPRLGPSILCWSLPISTLAHLLSVCIQRIGDRGIIPE